MHNDSDSKIPRHPEPISKSQPPPQVVNLEQIRLAQRGDLVAMSDLLDALMPWVGRLCGSIALDAGPDAAQETLMQVMRDLGSLRDPSALRGWVRRIATRESIRQAKRARRERPIDHVEETLASEPPGPAPDPMLARDVGRVLDSLPPDQRAILVLRDLEGLSEQEAAELLDLAHGTVKSRLHRAREAFRNRWSESFP